MKQPFLLPPIPESERTPLVMALVGIIEMQAQRIQRQEEQIELLKEEIRILKGGKKRPHFKPSKMEEHTEEVRRGEGAQQDQRRPGSDKRSKSAELVIHEERIIQPQRRIPKGSRFKGYRDLLIQDLVIRAHKHALPVGALADPEGRLCDRGVAGASEGSPLRDDAAQLWCCISTIIARSPNRCCAKQLREWGIQISSGAIDALLSAEQDDFHAEKDALLKRALATAAYVTVDDSGARHRGPKRLRDAHRQS